MDPEEPTDYGKTFVARRQTWFGLKRHVKSFMSLSGVHVALRALAKLHPAPWIGRLPAPRGVTEVVGRSGSSTFVMLRPDRCEVAKELYWGQGTRPKREDAFALELVVTLCGSADILVDIGAYTGIFSIAAAANEPELSVHAFEILPAASALLERNVDRNGFTGRIEIHPVGVGIPGKSIQLPASDEGSALPSFYSSRTQFTEGTAVVFESLDSLAPSIDPAASVVIKIDVEGTEADIFRHGSAFIAAFVPDILCEVLHDRADVDALKAMLTKHGYSAYLVTEDRLQRFDALTPDPRFRDWLFTKRDALNLEQLGIAISS